jgi:hypothetical protein
MTDYAEILIDCVEFFNARIVSVLASSAVDHGFESQSGQTKGYRIGICCFSAKHTALRRKSKRLGGSESE